MSQIDDVVVLCDLVGSAIHESQKERGMTAGFIGSGGKSFASDIDDQRNKVDGAYDALRGGYAEIGRDNLPEVFTTHVDAMLHDAEGLNTIRSRVTSLSIPAPDAIGYFSSMIGNGLNAVARTSSVTTDSWMTEAITSHCALLEMKERAGVERAVLSGAFAADEFRPGMYEKWLTIRAGLSAYESEFRERADALLNSMLDSDDSKAMFAEVDSFRFSAREHAHSGGFGMV
ncbi:MAG: nitrate- and nitrite sensing domain-containing protein [Phycisphaeraceae bacterium]|nr:nitrate- and nitrite sensing domain-containing protein [Phycisphaeraceae bacterium]